MKYYYQSLPRKKKKTKKKKPKTIQEPASPCSAIMVSKCLSR